ncbi:MAG: DcaP family trimeric outer membrane transporter [Hyphomonas sp.]|uniref:DcaP family trimeric outer membrane transporter n=1 Tax=Hyphomonas sp. TaxID=87 RepID=UPI003528A0A2
MSKSVRAIMLSTAAAVFALGASADGTMEDRVAALEEMVAELKAELAAERAKTDESIVRIEKTVAEAPAAAAPKTDGFKVGDTTLKFGGFIDADVHVTNLTDGGIASTSIARDFYIPSAIPVGGDETTFTDFTAEPSRFFLAASTPVGEGKVDGYIELDFLGSGQGNELVSNSYSPRLRRAFVKYGNWLVGQEWSTFQNTSAIPESASFLALPDGMIFIRQPQIRYTKGNWMFALENPNTTTLNAGSRDENLLPDVVARYNMTGDFGNVSFAGIARQLRADFGASEDETFGYGLSVSGLVKAGAKDDIRFNLVGGEGIGRYVGLAASRSAALDPNGKLEAIPSVGGLVAWRHPFGETARFSGGYSGLFVDNPTYLASTSTKSVQSAFGAVLWDVAPKTTLGVELMHGIREEESGNKGDMTRFTFSTKYAF